MRQIKTARITRLCALAAWRYQLHGSSHKTATPLDITDRADIERLVNAFYDKNRKDDLLGFIFNDVAKTEWATHLPKMYAFWETMIFRTRSRPERLRLPWLRCALH